MDSNRDGDGRQAISLLQSLDAEWLKLPVAAMIGVGPATQTLAGLLKVTNRETFTAVSEIAAKARLPVPTVRKHLATLDAKGWIANKGRGHTRAGKPRRTATLALTAKTRDHLEPYGFLPWWACCTIRRHGRLPWSAKALLAIVMGRLLTLKAAAERQGPQDEGDLIGDIENLGAEERFRFSLAVLEKQTGLTHDSVTAGKRHLHRTAILQWQGGKRDDGGTACDLLVPNWDFRVVVTPASAGRCYLDFRS
jgi:hypothetical protein